MKDVRGVEIVAGCEVAYPVRKGSKLWLSTMRVLQLDSGCLHGLRIRDGRQVKLTAPGRIVVVKPNDPPCGSFSPHSNRPGALPLNETK